MTGIDVRMDAWQRWRTWRAAMPAPVIVAPMSGVSTPELAAAACAAGFIGSFPAHNPGSPERLAAWLRIAAVRTAQLRRPDLTPAPLAVNLVMRRPGDVLAAEMDVIAAHQVPIVIASVGSPAPVVPAAHEAGAMVLADVATLRHARRALDAGADGLVLLSAGAGGQTGWMNGMAFVRAVRELYDGPIVLAGGISDGTALWSAEVLGCDMAYMGTPFIACDESGAEPDYQDALVAAEMDDVQLVTQRTGIDANLLGTMLDGPRAAHGFSAGHTVSAVRAVEPVATLVERTCAEYRAAQQRTRALIGA